MHEEEHLSLRAGWLRAAVLGANDGILSTSSILLGVAGSGASGSAVATAGVAGLVAGALSMAAGEYVSVSSQAADLRLEARELKRDPEGELAELASIYEGRGLNAGLARQVAEALSRHDALEAHVRDELGLADERRARPLQAAGSSAAAFAVGAALPLLAALLAPGGGRTVLIVVVTLLALVVLGVVGARAGGAPAGPAVRRVAGWGAIAMAVTYVIGALVGTAV